MYSNPYVKSVLWLIGFGGMGYGLMLLTEPSAEKIERIRASGSPTQLTVDEKKKALFMEKLKAAATSSTPIYRPAPAADKKDS
ncbi:uncharacterized protein LOC133847594 [Drosophila sulfurigaster albostrigata]|uniref:Uncharacterized protein LOC117564737 n=1 Tax=Drosophila albomicans TaxID=7291 RepID=A0A6P8W7B6_DROAB|nr:uncharacterized protein LOC117564737 [Drosophila albomicans]XP_060666389.1 uncharacterized protein LOC132798521 [Drosophila nasuta]XP_062138739.1 uncharacterized protein LOC133847594 [Drosophila sulfurigaster albostrigata]